ncbi:MAG TPA: phospholipid carrier-dependent glycosyltransferase [Patescibacteria group bacterium]|nr:phospholipid carrier-dependent glycosyltransferase [Patescibacteria group bacterium]
MKKFLNKFCLEIVVFGFALFTRFWRLDYPKTHIFDEVYHAFTAQAMVKWDPRSWEWWNTSPAGFAYEWTHPPLAKEFMALSILVFGDTSFAWRFFSALFGFGSIILIYLISYYLFKNRRVALLSALVASLDGLLLVMSRIAMNDSYFLFFSLLSIYLFLKKRNFLMGLSLGLAIASKWTGFFAIIIILALFIYENLNSRKLKSKNILKFVFFLFVTPLVIYIASYTPFFLQRHIPPNQNFTNVQTFIELQQQMWWYHTNLKATHPYQSTPFDWIFDLRPVWLFVDYQKEKVANIYTLENPMIAWFGLVSILFLVFEFFKKRTLPYLLVPLSYLSFFVLWFHSPRIMFNYHYLASTAFLAIAIGFTLNKLMNSKLGKVLFFSFLILMISLSIYFYPLWTGVSVATDFNNNYFWIKSWK